MSARTLKLSAGLSQRRSRVPRAPNNRSCPKSRNSAFRPRHQPGSPRQAHQEEVTEVFARRFKRHPSRTRNNALSEGRATEDLVRWAPRTSVWISTTGRLPGRRLDPDWNPIDVQRLPQGGSNGECVDRPFKFAELRHCQPGQIRNLAPIERLEGHRSCDAPERSRVRKAL